MGDIMNINSFTKIFGTINNTLNIMNKAMPVYKEIKPIINNINKVFKKNNNIISILKTKQIHNKITKKTLNNKNIYNNPKFFIEQKSK